MPGFAKARLEELKQSKAASWWSWSSGKPAEAGKPQDTQAHRRADETRPCAEGHAGGGVTPGRAPARDAGRTGVRRAARGCRALEYAALHQAGLWRGSFQGLPGLPRDGDRAGGSFTMGSPESEPERN